MKVTQEKKVLFPGERSNFLIYWQKKKIKIK